MISNRRFLFLLILSTIFVSFFINGFSAPIVQKTSERPVHNLSYNTYIREWLVAGPFPNPATDEELPDGSYHYGFYTDFLKSIGGENKAVFEKNTSIRFTDQHGEAHVIGTQSVKAGENGIIDFDKMFNKIDQKVAYAFCYLNVVSDQEAFFLFGSDDGAKVWINGMLVHKNYVARALKQDDDRFSAKLKQGLNPILVKIEDRVRDWGFVLKTVDEGGYQKIIAEEQAKKDFNDFLNCSIVPKQLNTWNYVFVPGEFPELQWERPYLVEKVMGKFPLNVRWFDSELNEVKKADKPGRYAFMADGITANGIQIRRAATMYCMPRYWISWGERPKANLEFLPVDFINKKIWEEHSDPISYFTGRIALLSILNQKEGAILMSYLHEMKTEGKPPTLTDTPIIRDHDYHLALKRKLLGVEHKWQPLQMPQKIVNKPAAILHEGSEQEAGIKLGTADKIRSVCQQWYEKSGEPFIVFVARHGVIIIHEAFGERSDGLVTLETATEMASITKLLTGVMFAQFVDQRLINIDDPVGKYLPDFPIEGDKAVTLRHCFTHTSGLWGHEEWGGLHNPYLDNVIANLIKELPVGKIHNYNGMGYDLAGKVMEMVSGKSIFRLMRENFFDPLGLSNTILEEDLGFSCFSTAGEFAVFGQLLLNRGTYGDLKFFTPETFEQLLPKPLNQFYPDINVEWGIGLTWMRQWHPDAGKNGIPEDQTVLSKNVIGHGSATSAILRVDLDNDLVICQTRRRGGKYYEKYLAKLLMAIDKGLKD